MDADALWGAPLLVCIVFVVRRPLCILAELVSLQGVRRQQLGGRMQFLPLFIFGICHILWTAAVR